MKNLAFKPKKSLFYKCCGNCANYVRNNFELGTCMVNKKTYSAYNKCGIDKDLPYQMRMEDI